MLNAGPGKQSGVDIENRFCLLIEKKKNIPLGQWFSKSGP